MNEFNGIVQGFGRYSTTQLEQAKQNLHLDMTVRQLGICSHYYSRIERRDPLIAELRLLDDLARTQKNNPAAYEITELYTNDRHVAETYADVMQKRSALTECTTAPCTLRDLGRIATAYLERAGKHAPLDRHVIALQNSKSTHRRPPSDAGICIEGSNHSLLVQHMDARAAEIQVGDVLLLLLPKRRKAVRDYAKTLSTFLQANGAATPWKRIAAIENGGLLPSLLGAMEAGFWFDLSKFAEAELASPLAPLTDLYVGCHIVLVSPDNQKAVALRAEELGMEALSIATSTHSSRITFASGDTVLFSLEASFLRSLQNVDTATAILPDEGNTPSTVWHTPNASACRYLESASTERATDCCTVGDTVCAAAHCKPDASYYQNALYTTLAPILALSAAGYGYSEQRLALGITLPVAPKSNPDTIGCATSLVLGIYRAQAELGVPAPAVSIQQDAKIAAPELTVYAIANGTAPAEGFQEEENLVYCIQPTQRDALPDFDSLRYLMHELTAKRRDQSIVSTRILVNESVTDGLTAMATDCLYCHANDRYAAEGKLPLAVLIESRIPIKDLPLVGTVRRKAEQAIQPASTEPAVAHIHSLIWSSQREVLLLAKEDDTHAYALADIIEEKGGHAVVLTDDLAKAGPLSRALLGAQLLIVCGDANIPMTEQTSFALDTMLRAGGACWIVGRTEYAPLASRATVFRRIPSYALDTVLNCD